MEWKTSWSYLPVDFGTVIATVSDISQKTVFWNNLSGSAVCIRFSNRYGTGPLKIAHASLSFTDREHPHNPEESSSKSNGTKKDFPITFAGSSSLTLEPGREVLCDIINLDIEPGMNPVVSLYFKECCEVSCAMSNWAGGNYESTLVRGDYAAGEGAVIEDGEVFPSMAVEDVSCSFLIGVCEIRVLTDKKPKTIAMFGDSLTHMSFYTNELMRKLYRDYPGRVSVINCGLGGNRVLRDASFLEDVPGNGRSSGPSGLSRFEIDVYDYTEPDFVFLLEGVNDLMHPYFLGRPEELPTSEDLIGAYTVIADRAHGRGSKIFFATLSPFKSKEYPFGDEGLRVMSLVNGWIRTQNVSDGVFDFEKVLRDPADPYAVEERLHLGDGLHPGTEGGRRMAEEAVRVFCEKCQF